MITSLTLAALLLVGDHHHRDHDHHYRPRYDHDWVERQRAIEAQEETVQELRKLREEERERENDRRREGRDREEE